MKMNDTKPANPGWYWKQTHWDCWALIGPPKEMLAYRGSAYVKSLDGAPPFSFRSYADLCWWCGSRGINATQV
jgi:hypothetical protein